jgi:hypothetical protein
MKGRRPDIMLTPVPRLTALLHLLVATGLLGRKAVCGINAVADAANMATVQRQRGRIMICLYPGVAQGKGKTRNRLRVRRYSLFIKDITRIDRPIHVNTQNEPG